MAEELKANVYINFNGRAREAMESYKEVLGGELDLLAADPDGPPKAAQPGERIMHARLVSGGVTIMGTDGSPDYPASAGDNFAVALIGSDRERLTKIFDRLSSDGGKAKSPLKQESWGDTFGWLKDKFGINWMIDITQPTG